MIALYSKLRSRAQRRGGFSLIEMLVVIAIMGILIVASAGIVTVIFNSNIQSSEYMTQQATITSSFGFFAQKFASAQIPAAVANSSGTSVNPLSMAGDQIIFKAQNGTWVRAFYQQDAEEIRVEVTSSLTDDIPSSCSGCQGAVRGPNQTPERAMNGGSSPCVWNSAQQCALPGDPDFDPALDLAPGETCSETYTGTQYSGDITKCESLGSGLRGAIVLSTNVLSARPSNADTTQFPDATLQVFKYLDQYDQSIVDSSSNGTWTNAGPDLYACANQSGFGSCPNSEWAGGSDGTTANAGSENSWYTTASESSSWNDVDAIGMTMYLGASGSSSGVHVKTLPYYEQYALAQGSSNAVNTPGTVLDSGQIVGTDSTDTESISPGNGASVQINNNSTPGYLEIPATDKNIGTSPDSWLEFSGQLPLSATSATSATIKVVLQDSAGGISDYQNRNEVDIPVQVQPGGTQATPFSGRFLLPPSGAASTTDHYRIVVELSVPASGAAVSYGMDPAQEWLSWDDVLTPAAPVTNVG